MRREFSHEATKDTEKSGAIQHVFVTFAPSWLRLRLVGMKFTGEKARGGQRFIFGFFSA